MSTGVMSPTLNGFPVPAATQGAEPFNPGMAYTMAEPQIPTTISMAPYAGIGKSCQC